MQPLAEGSAGRSLVVGFDGSEHGSDALALARALGRLTGGGIRVVLAVAPAQRLLAPGTAAPRGEQERLELSARARAELDGSADVQVSVVEYSSAAGALQVEAERDHAELIVVGSSHRGRAGRILLGTVTQAVVDAAPCAVAVAPAGFAAAAPERFTTVGVGFDDSPEAAAALALAASIARRAGAELHILWAAHLVARTLPSAFAGYLKPDYFEQARAEVERRLEEVAAPLRDGLPGRTEVLSGSAGEALATRSAGLGLLVVGSRGYGPLGRVLLGSVTRALLSEAHCPVLVLPRAAAGRGGSG